MADIRRVIEIDVKTSAQAVATMRQIAEQAEAMEKRFAAVQSTAQNFITTLIGGLTVGGIIHSIRSTTEAFDEMGKRSERLGIATEELSALTYQAKLAHISAEQLDTAMGKLSKNLAGVEDIAGSGAKALQQLGIAGDDPMKALEAVAEQFSKMEDGAKKTALAMDLFGKSGKQMIPLLNQGADGIRRAREEAAAYGLIVGKEAVEASQRFNEAMDRMAASSQGARNKLLGPMIEGLATLADKFYGAGTAALSFSDKLKLAFPTADVNAKFEAWNARLKELDVSIAKVQERTATGEIFLGPKQESIDAFNRQKGAIIALMFAEKNRMELAHQVEQQQADAAAARAKGGAVDIDLSKATKEVDHLTGALNRLVALSTEGKIAALETQLDEMNDLFSAGLVSEKALTEVSGKLTREILKQGDAYDKLTAELEDEADAAQAVEDRIEALYEKFLLGEISLAKFNAEVDKARGKTLDMKDTYQELGEAIQRSVEGWSAKSAQLLVDFANGTQTSVRKMVDGILQEFELMAIQILIFDPLFRSFAQLVRGMFPGGASAGPAWGANEALGGVYGPDGRMAFARGGVVNRPTLFPFAGGTGLMGEAGPEAIMPLKRSASGALGVEANGGGGITVNVINKSNADVSVEHGRNASDERTITVMVEQSVQDAFSRGRFDSLMSSTYGLNRRGR